jgi:hypothetical protein
MTKLEIFNGLMERAKSNGYIGPDYRYETGHILDGTNAYAVFFREDFSIAIWGSESSDGTPRWKIGLQKLVLSEDKWKFLENNVLID